MDTVKTILEIISIILPWIGWIILGIISIITLVIWKLPVMAWKWYIERKLQKEKMEKEEEKLRIEAVKILISKIKDIGDYFDHATRIFEENLDIMNSAGVSGFPLKPLRELENFPHTDLLFSIDIEELLSSNIVSLIKTNQERWVTYYALLREGASKEDNFRFDMDLANELQKYLKKTRGQARKLEVILKAYIVIGAPK